MYGKIASILLVALSTVVFAFPPSEQIDTPEPNVLPPVRLEALYPNPYEPYVANPCAEFEGTPDDEAELADVQVPIPMKDRVFNRTGIQCVWCSCECLGRWAEEPKLIGPPCMTDLRDCKSYSGPDSAGRKLTQLQVKFLQTEDKRKGREMIRQYVVKERRGVLFDIKGHAMNLVHFDEEKRIVKYINNSDQSLKIRTWSMDEFERRWQGWVLVLWADNDIIPYKLTVSGQLIPIVDRMGNDTFDAKKLILIPSR